MAELRSKEAAVAAVQRQRWPWCPGNGRLITIARHTDHAYPPHVAKIDAIEILFRTGVSTRFKGLRRRNPPVRMSG